MEKRLPKAEQLKRVKALYGLSISEGNKKLVPIPGVCNFLIFNLPAVVSCPFATDHCKKLCYALKAERCYPSARAARLNNYEFSQSDLFVPVMLELIAAYMNSNKYKNVPCYFRIHESGDFYSQVYFNKWLEIITACKDLYPNLYFCAYTKSYKFIPYTDYNQFKQDHPNFIINISIWDDSPADIVSFAKTGNYPIYTAAAGAELQKLLTVKTNLKCSCANCGKCKLCLINHDQNYKKICEIH